MPKIELCFGSEYALDMRITPDSLVRTVSLLALRKTAKVVGLSHVPTRETDYDTKVSEIHDLGRMQMCGQRVILRELG